MNTTEWTPRIDAAERYLNAQYAFMAVATSDAPLDDALLKLDAVRKSRVAFNAIPPVEFRETKEFSPAEAADAVVFLEKRLKAHQNEKLVYGWLEATELPPEIANFERTYGLDTDPDNDLFVIGGKNSVELIKALRERKFLRLIDAANIVVGDSADQIDELKFAGELAQLPNINSVRPNRLHYINSDIDQETHESQLEQMKSRIQLFYVSRNTNVLMAPLWTPNVLRNLPKFAAEGRDALGLSKKFKGTPAIVIGAGPSLDELLPQIAEVQEKMVIVCAFKALRAVTARGINPDVVICLDPKQKIRHLEGVDLSRVGAFFIEVASNPELVSNMNGCPIVPFVASVIPLELIRSTGAIDIPVMGTGGSALHGAIQAALLLGCRKIYLAGADFGFPDNRLYASGAGTGDRFTVSDDGRSYERQPLDSHYRGGELYPVKANDGGVIGASTEMIQFREWVEARIQRASSLEEPTYFFNLSPRGAVVDGAPYVANIDISTLTEERKNDIRRLTESCSSVSKISAGELKKRFRTRQEKLRRMVSICECIKEKQRKGEDWNRDLAKMIKSAKKNLDISLMINAHLIKLDEYMARVHAVGAIEAEVLIMKLIQETELAAKSLIETYGEATSGRSA